MLPQTLNLSTAAPLPGRFCEERPDWAGRRCGAALSLLSAHFNGAGTLCAGEEPTTGPRPPVHALFLSTPQRVQEEDEHAVPSGLSKRFQPCCPSFLYVKVNILSINRETGLEMCIVRINLAF